MKDLDAQLIMEAYNQQALLNEFINPLTMGALYAAAKAAPDAVADAIPWFKNVVGELPGVSLVGKGMDTAKDVAGSAADVAGSAADVAGSAADTADALNGSLTAIAAIFSPTTIITAGLVIAGIMGTRALIKYTEDKRAKKQLDDRIRHANSVIDSVGKMFDPKQEILPPEAIEAIKA